MSTDISMTPLNLHNFKNIDIESLKHLSTLFSLVFILNQWTLFKKSFVPQFWLTLFFTVNINLAFKKLFNKLDENLG